MKGGIILWAKEKIKFPAGSAPWTTAPPPSHRRSPSPPSPRRSPPPDYDHHSASPSRSPLPDLGRSCSPPPPPAKETKRKRVKDAPSMSSSRRSPKRRRSPLPKVPHKNLPVLAYHRTQEEIEAISNAEVAAHFAKKDPEPKPLYTEKQNEYAVDLLTAERQYDLHHKPDEYTHTLA